MINLSNNKGFKWIKRNNLHVKGYLADTIEENSSLINLQESTVLVDYMKNSKGFFSLVLETDHFIFAAVDRVRSIPLFYGIYKGEFYLSDDARWIQGKVKDMETDEVSISEFYLTGYVTGSDTFFLNVKQLQAGEYLIYDKKQKNLKTSHYFKFTHGDYFSKGESELIEELDRVHVTVFKRLIKSLNGRTVVLPLSGGYDSRLIAVMLKRLGYENVICFTYGKEGNQEAQISKSVAEKLGYSWIFIPYTEEKWHAWYKSKDREKYFEYADGLCSLPHIQDIVAVEELRKNKLIPVDAVFIPGHSGDFVAGSHIPLHFLGKEKVPRNLIEEQIFNVHYNLWGNEKILSTYREKFVEKAFMLIEDKQFYTSDEAADIYEQWDWAERQSKFICHSIRVYDYCRYEWRLPLWEKEIIEFWERIKLEKRFNRNLYFKYVDKKQTEFQDLNTNENGVLLYNVKKIVKRIKPLYKLIIKKKKSKELLTHPLNWYSIIEENDKNSLELGSGFQINSYLSMKYVSKFKKNNSI